MLKRILITIGVVVGSIMVILGGIAGVLAIMGKFKEPVVYPEKLLFEQSHVLVDESLACGVAGQDKIYSFVLKGTSKEEYPVNKATCYLSVLQGRDIITLCDQDGEALKPSTGNKFKVRCNRPVYYRINKDEFSGEQKVGTVIIEATDERGAISSNLLRLDFDSALTTVYVDAVSGVNGVISNQRIPKTDFKEAQQSIELNIGGRFYLDYVFTPNNAYKPIQDKDAKIIELYYVGSADYFEVNSETAITNTLKDFIKFDNDQGKYYFSSQMPGTFEFKIAYFPTYNEKVKYEQENAENPPTGFYRVHDMQFTTLRANVKNTTVENVSITNGATLDLYLNNNYISLCADDVIEGMNNNNINLTYTPANQETDLRYKEAIFIPSSIELFEEIVLVSEDEEALYINYNSDLHDIKDDDNDLVFSLDVKNSNVTLMFYSKFGSEEKALNFGSETNPRYVITEIINNKGYKYSTSGMGTIVVERSGEKWVLKQLSSGTYLDMLIENEKEYTKWQDYTATRVEGYDQKQKTWNIVAEDFPGENKNLVLGVWVVNSDGTVMFANAKSYVYEKTIEADNISFVNENRTHSLKVSYDNNGKAVCQTILPEEIYSIPQNITYNQSLLFTPKTEDGIYNVDVIEDVVFKAENEKEYVLVGYETTGEGEKRIFNNVVRINKNATKYASLYVAQVKTSYLQSSKNFVESRLEEIKLGNLTNEDVLDETLVNLFISKPIKINPDYDISILKDISTNKIKTSLAKVEYNEHDNNEETDNVIEYIQDSVGQISIVFNSVKKLEDEEGYTDVAYLISNLYDLIGEIEFASCFNFTHANIQNVEVGLQKEYETENGKINLININFNVDAPLSGGDLVNLTFEYGGIVINFTPINILSSKPVDIAYENEDKGISNKLYRDDEVYIKEAIRTDLNKFVVTLGVDTQTKQYVANWQYLYKVDGEPNHTTVDLPGFSLTTSGPFMVLPFYAEGKESFNYAVRGEGKTLNTSVMEVVPSLADPTQFDVVFNGTGVCVLEVKVAESVMRYIVVEVKAEENKFSFTPPTATQSEPLNKFSLEEDIYSYDQTPIPNLIKLENITTPTQSGYQFGPIDESDILKGYSLYYNTYDNNGNFKEKVDVLYAKRDANGIWEFIRGYNANSTLTVDITISTVTNGKATINLVFSPTIAVDLNTQKGWYATDGEIVVYQGTTAKIFAQAQDREDLNSSNAMFKVVAPNNLISVEFEHGFDELTPKATFNTVGEFQLSFIDTKNDADDTTNEIIATYTIKVVPNIVVNVVNTEFVESKTDNQFINVYKYQTLSYGDTRGGYPKLELNEDGSLSLNCSGVLELISTWDANLKIAQQNHELLTLNGNESVGTISAGHIPQMGKTISDKIKLSYNDYEIDVYQNGELKTEIDVTISNNYVLELSDSLHVLDVIKTALNLKINGVAVENELTGVMATINDGATSLEIKNENGEYIIATHVGEIYNDLKLEFTFTVDGKDYFTTREGLTLKPYLPIENNFVYSDSQDIDLVDVIFNDAKNGISNIIPKGFANSDHQQYFTSINFGADNSLPAKVKELHGPEQDVVLNFDLEYKNYAKLTTEPANWSDDFKTFYCSTDGTNFAQNSNGNWDDVKDKIYKEITVVYNYPHTLKIKNRDQLTTKYPYADVQVVGASVNLVKRDENGIADTSVTLKLNPNDYYEPVVLGQTIDLSEVLTTGLTDEVLRRVNIKDNGTEGGTQETIESIVVDATSETNADLYRYIYTAKQIKYDGTKITFGKDTPKGPASLGYIRFKYTTSHKNIGYYVVRLYNQIGSGASTYHNLIDATANQEISVDTNSNELQFKFVSKDSKYYTFAIDGTTEVRGTEIDIANTFKVGNFDANKVSMYLIDVKSPAGVTLDNDGNIMVGDQNIGLTFFQRLDDSTNPAKIIKPFNNHATLKVALVYTSGSSKFCFGTLTIHVQPEKSVAFDNDGFEANTNKEWKANTYYEKDGSNYNLLGTKPANWGADYNTYFVKILENTYKYASGYFTKTLPNNTQSYLPAIGDVCEAEILNGTEVDDIVEVDDTDSKTLKFLQYVDKNTTILVKYGIDLNGNSEADMFVVVEYTYLPFDMEAVIENNTSVTVGLFDYNNKIFKNTLNIQDLLGDYNKAYSLVINYEAINEQATLDKDGTFINEGAKVPVSYESGVLTFKQNQSEYSVAITITFEDYTGANKTKNVTVNIAEGVYIVNNSAVNATETGDYSSVNGSHIKILTGTGEGYVKYSYQGFEVYLATSSVTNPTLQLTYRTLQAEDETDQVYYVNGLTMQDETINEEVYKTTNFPHLAKDINVELDISFMFGGIEGEDYQASSTDTPSVLKVNVPKTYSSLKFNYLVGGADHENVSHGEWGAVYSPKTSESYEENKFYTKSGLTYTLLTGETAPADWSTAENKYFVKTSKTIYDMLFGPLSSEIIDVADDTSKNILNNCRTSLEPPYEDKELGVVDFTAMGFNTSTNPNYLTFTAPGVHMVKDGNVLKFNLENATEPASANLSITNQAGLNCVYNFQYILGKVENTETKLFGTNNNEGLEFFDQTAATYSVANKSIAYFVNTTQDNSGNYQIKLKDGTNNTDTFATLLDNKNNGFYITSINVKVDGVEASITKKEKSDNSYTFTIKDKNNVVSTLTISCNGSNQLNLSFASNEINDVNKIFNKMVITLDMHGDTGYICEDFTISLYNYQKLEDVNLSVLATEIVDLNDYIKFTQNGTGTTGSDSNLTYDLISVRFGSDHIIEGDDLNNLEEETSGLLRYDETNSIIYTGHTPENKYPVLKFNIIDNGVIIDTFNLTLSISNSLVFVVNDSGLTGRMFNTDFSMTDCTETTASPTAAATPTTGGPEYMATRSLKYTNGGNNALTVRLFNALKYSEGTTELGVDYRLFNITLIEGYGVVELDETEKTLKFKKDITTTEESPVMLQLSYECYPGVYYTVDWAINIKGYNTASYVLSEGENGTLNNGGDGFASGTSVVLIGDETTNSTQSGLETNLMLTRNDNWLAEPYNPGSSTSRKYNKLKVKADVSYVVRTKEQFELLKDGKGFTSKEEAKVSTIETSDFSNNRLTIKLPMVNQSTVIVPWYYVTFKVTLNYFGFKQGTYYVTYRVYNDQKFEEGDNSILVTSDNNIIVANYYEEFKEGSNTLFRIRRTDNKDGYTSGVILETVNTEGSVVSVVDKFTYKGTTTEGNTITTTWLKEGVAAAEYSLVYENGKYKFNNGSETTKVLVQGGDEVMFKSSFNDIIKYYDSTNRITSVRFSNMVGFAGDSSLTEIYFKTTLNEDGTMSIDLSSYYKTASCDGDSETDKLFNNTLTATVSLCSGSDIIYSYTGFTLTQNGTITSANTLKRLDDIFTTGQLGKASAYGDKEIIGVFNKADIVVDKIGEDKIGNYASWVKVGDSVGTNENISEITATYVCEISHGSIHNSIYNPISGYSVGLYKLTYSGNNTATAVYDVQQEFYAIGTSDGKLTLIDYATRTANTTYFSVNYNYDPKIETQEFTVDMVKTYSMENGVLTAKGKTPTTKTIGNNELISYKQNNPTKTIYECTYKVDGMDLVVRWKLPEDVSGSQT